MDRSIEAILHFARDPPVAVVQVARFSQTLVRVNDSAARLGVMQGEYHWHEHADDNEFFFAPPGHFFIDLDRLADGVTPSRAVIQARDPKRRVPTTLIPSRLRDDDQPPDIPECVEYPGELQCSNGALSVQYTLSVKLSGATADFFPDAECTPELACIQTRELTSETLLTPRSTLIVAAKKEVTVPLRTDLSAG